MKNIKSPCEICDKLGERLRIDNIEGEHFPDEFKKLETVPDTDGDIRRCPLCGQTYAYDNRFDNDVYNLYDVSEIHRVSEDTVNSIIDSIKKRIDGLHSADLVINAKSLQNKKARASSRKKIVP